MDVSNNALYLRTQGTLAFQRKLGEPDKPANEALAPAQTPQIWKTVATIALAGIGTAVASGAAYYAWQYFMDSHLDNEIYLPETLNPSFQEYLESEGIYNAVKYAEECIGDTSKRCQQVVKDAFLTFLEKNTSDRLEAQIFSNYASKIAIGCIGQKDGACQEIVKGAYSKLLEKPGYGAANFIESCFGETTDQCQRVVSDAFSQLLAKDSSKAGLLATDCIGKVNNACREIVDGAFAKIVEQEPDCFHAIYFAVRCIGNTSDQCQKVVTDAFSRLSTIPHHRWSSLARQCIGEEDKACQEIVSKAFSRALSEKSEEVMQSFARDCKGKTDIACQNFLRQMSVGTALPD